MILPQQIEAIIPWFFHLWYTVFDMEYSWIERLLDWYAAAARDLPWRHTTEAYPVWISEVMLQQTRVEAVRGYWSRFLAALPTVEALAAVEESRLLKLWEGLGYYSRARNLQRAAQQVMERFDGRIPADYEALLSLPGVGEYTAGAVASISFGIPVPAVDGNVLRVMARLANDDADVLDPAVRRAVRSRLLSCIPHDRPGAFNQSLMELGATVCLPNGAPHCGDCPLRADCCALAAGREQLLPVRAAKRTRRVEDWTVFVLRNATGAVAGYRREAQGLLASLWQLPDAPGALTAEQAAARLDAWGARPLGTWRFYERKHIFTHVEWRLHVCALDVELHPLPQGWVWLDETVHSLPTAYRICL